MELLSRIETGSDVRLPDGATPAMSRSQRAMVMERLPFTVRIAQGESDLEKAVSIRHAAYARHVPQVAATLRSVEAPDRDEGSVVLLAESKMDGSPLGTMRIQTTRYERLPLERSVKLPDWLQGKLLAEAVRLGVVPASIGRVVKTVLFKAFYQYCLLADVDWMVIAARSPLDKQYEGLLFQDVFPDGAFIPMAHAGNIPHRVLAFEVATAKTRWAAAGHPLLDFMCRTHHPDLQLHDRVVPFYPISASLAESSQQIRLKS